MNDEKYKVQDVHSLPFNFKKDRARILLVVGFFKCHNCRQAGNHQGIDKATSELTTNHEYSFGVVGSRNVAIAHRRDRGHNEVKL